MNRILYNRPVGSGYFRMGIEWEARRRARHIRPGQFVMIRVTEGLDPLLRRPLGVYKIIEARAGASPGGVEVLYKVVGAGTRILSEKSKGESVDLIGPFGNGFPPAGTKRVVMVAGGIGTVPFYLISRSLDAGVLLFGGRFREDTVLLKDFKGLDLRVATEDGGVGTKGLVTDLLPAELTGESVVYACGPSGMLKAVASIAADAGVKCFVSLERAMACGIGVCLGCAVKTRAHAGGDERGYRMVCSDGPVFESTEIDWELF